MVTSRRIGAVEDAEKTTQHADAASERLPRALEAAEQHPERFREPCRLILPIWLYAGRKPRIETRIPPSAAF